MRSVKVLGPGCANCTRLEQVTRQALSELGIPATIEKVTDFPQIMQYGILRTPGLVVDDRVVLSGRVPDLAELKALLRAQ